MFGFRSVIASQVHRSLVAADNALAPLSAGHPDGWGVAYYVEGAPHVTRSTSTALEDQIFHRVSGVVSSETVIAHVRKATQGELSVLNCHPFQYGRWTFAHNGDIPDFEQHREALMDEIAPRLRRFVLGTTDSEVLFFLFLSHLSALGPLSQRFTFEDVATTLRGAAKRVREICDQPGHKPSLLTFLVTDGTTMAAMRGGKELFYSTYKSGCSERETCPYLKPYCESPSPNGNVSHLLFSSEPLEGENVWLEMEDDDIIGIDWRMRVLHAQDKRTLTTV